MEPKIKQLKETKLTGMYTHMSFANDKTVELWRSFGPRKKEITHSVDANLFSVEIYPNPGFFLNFNPRLEFEKWAAIEVSSFSQIPDGMEKLVIPAGDYAVFHYKGKPSQAQATFQYIFGEWLPNSTFTLDNRPHFALMGEKYKGEHPDSEEEFWIPVRQPDK